mgnify:CR=1 FL=1
MIAASLMHRGLSILRGCPRISDVFCMEEILKSLGAVTWWDDHDLYLDCSCADGTEIPAVYTGRMRSSIILAGAVLARNRKCRIGYPGGCTIGKRPIDFHLMALRALGADVRENASGLDGECVRFEKQRFFIRYPVCLHPRKAVLPLKGRILCFRNRVWELLNRQYWQQFLQKV